MTVEKNILREDYIIRVRPTLDKQLKWNGVVEVSIIANPKNRRMMTTIQCYISVN